MAPTWRVDDVQHQFSVTGPMETKLKAALLDSVEFLSLITTMDVDQIKGQVVKVGNYGIATGRKRDGRFFTENGLNGHEYELAEISINTAKCIMK